MFGLCRDGQVFGRRTLEILFSMLVDGFVLWDKLKNRANQTISLSDPLDELRGPNNYQSNDSYVEIDIDLFARSAKAKVRHKVVVSIPKSREKSPLLRTLDSLRLHIRNFTKGRATAAAEERSASSVYSCWENNCNRRQSPPMCNIH